MTFYSLVLFVHVTAMLGLFAALTIETLALFHLRRASSLTGARFWLDPVPGLPLAAGGSLLVVFFTGIYLTLRISAFDAAWPRVSMAAILLVAPIAAITARRMAAIRRTLASAAEISADLRARLQAPFLKTSLGIRIAVMLGIVLLMGAKPGLWESTGIVAGSAGLETGIASLYGRPGESRR